MNYHQINFLKIEEDRYAFFDVFHKDNKIIFICPVYVKNQNPYLLKIKDKHNNIYLQNPTVYLRDNYEPICIIIYDFKSDNILNEFVCEYEDKYLDIILLNYKSSKKYTLTQTTLFKDDYNLINIFIDYYDKQGVEKYIFYYNGNSTDEIKNICNRENILLIDWNFKYWNSNSIYLHHAQIGQIHHALYKYGKNETEYMIFNDLDEYMHIPNIKLIEILNSNANTYIFQNCWAKTLDNTVDLHSPKTLKIGNPLKYPNRSKCIHKVDDIIYLGIHLARKYTVNNPIIINDSYKLLHFYSWSNLSRVEKTGKLFYI